MMNFSKAHSAPGSVTPVRFKEVVVYFSEEEWTHLDPWQKELYSNVMRDIHTVLLSLGYTILHPDVLCRIRRDHEPYISSREEDKKGVSFPSSSASALSPDIIFRIKHDEEVWMDEEDGDRRFPKSKMGFPAEISEVLNDEEGKCRGEKTEDQKNSHNNGEFTLQTNEASQLVFNPKFSIWIKQVDEVSERTPEVISAACTDGNVAKIKTETDVTPECDKLLAAQDRTEAASDKNTTVLEKSVTSHRAKHAGKEEESLLSLVLRRANTGSLYIPNYKYPNSYKDLDCSPGVPTIVEEEMHYQSQQTPNSNDLLSSFHAPLQHCAPQQDRPFRCRICNKSFKTLGILNVHLKTHSGVRPYQCGECGKSFRDNWNLKVHQKIHTGETPYKCTICDKGFIQYATYMKHRRIHTGEKPYSCCYCDKRFTNSSNLVRHYRTHTGEKPYTCMECGKSFSYNTSLIQHKRIHKVEPTLH